MGPTLVLFRRDLRLDDNPALAAAWGRGGAVLPVFILEPSEGRGLGGASAWWLHHSLAELASSLRRHRLPLILRRGELASELGQLIQASGAEAVYWNRRYEPAGIATDKALKEKLSREGVEVRSFNAALLHEPHAVSNRQGGPFQVFTPYWRCCLALEVQASVSLPTGSPPAPTRIPASLSLEALSLLPTIPWDSAFPRFGEPGEAGAARRLARFLESHLDEYDTARDLPAEPGTSGLSAHLHWGELSPRRLREKLLMRAAQTGVFPGCRGEERFLAELGWREFAHHLLYHFPHTAEQPLRDKFSRFPWAPDPGGVLLKAWQQGRTGYPIVDAGMRQLWHCGWMHNRVRMVAASFLVKHLRLPWQEGARWFSDTLVDADLAANTLGWQWAAGCGADAAPYFRIFNPVLQGEKFDPEGAYVRRWLPELGRVPARFVHRPWEAPPGVLAEAGVRLGREYPGPVVDHVRARAAALAALASLKE